MQAVAGARAERRSREPLQVRRLEGRGRRGRLATVSRETPPGPPSSKRAPGRWTRREHARRASVHKGWSTPCATNTAFHVKRWRRTEHRAFHVKRSTRRTNGGERPLRRPARRLLCSRRWFGSARQARGRSALATVRACTPRRRPRSRLQAFHVKRWPRPRLRSPPHLRERRPRMWGMVGEGKGADRVPIAPSEVGSGALASV